MLQRAIRKQIPTPTLVNATIDAAIAVVEGKATLRIKL